MLPCWHSGAAQAAWGARAQSKAARAKATAAAAKPTRVPLSPEELDKLRELVAGTDQAAVIAATAALGDSSATNASLPLIELLIAGASPPAAIAAIDGLRKLRDPSSIDVLVLYASNRARHAPARRQGPGNFPDRASFRR